MAETLDFSVLCSWGYTLKRFIYTLSAEAAQVAVQIGTADIAGGMRRIHNNWYRLRAGKCTTHLDSPLLSGMLIYILYGWAGIIAPAADTVAGIGGPNLWLNTDGSTISGGAQFASSCLGLCHCYHLLVGHHCGHHRQRAGSSTHVCTVSGKRLSKLLAGICWTYAFVLQGIHTMLPISWPVSVVLAVFMTAIHIVCKIGTSKDYAPNLPMVSFSICNTHCTA